MTETDWDLAIIGSGSAAFSAAIRATTLGARVVIIEKGVIGGTCVNVGCVPSKALLTAAAARHEAMTQSFRGIVTQAGTVDLAALVAHKDELVAGLRKEKYEDLAALYGFAIKRGAAHFADADSLVIEGHGTTETIRAHSMLIATGAFPSVPPIPGLAEVPYLTSTSAMESTALPESLVVIGGNAVGLEQAQLMARLGAHVTLIEARDRIAPFEEPEISEALTQILGDEGIEVITGAAIERVGKRGETIDVTFSQSSQQKLVTAEAILVATGRVPNTGDLGLRASGVATGSRGEVIVDAELRTTNPKVFAAGDVTGAPQFVYVAGYHGTIVADNAIGNAGRKVDYRTLPRVTFTSPQVASVGLTDDQAVAVGYQCSCRVLSLEAVPRALVNRDTRGLIKIVADGATGEVLGIHLLANGAADAILAGVYALEARMTVEQLSGTWAPYLTMGEAIRLGAQAFTRDVSRLSCCAS